MFTCGIVTLAHPCAHDQTSLELGRLKGKERERKRERG
jgi:hypothetical protein